MKHQYPEFAIWTLFFVFIIMWKIMPNKLLQITPIIFCIPITIIIGIIINLIIQKVNYIRSSHNKELKKDE